MVKSHLQVYYLLAVKSGEGVNIMLKQFCQGNYTALCGYTDIGQVTISASGYVIGDVLYKAFNLSTREDGDIRLYIVTPEFVEKNDKFIYDGDGSLCGHYEGQDFEELFCVNELIDMRIYNDDELALNIRTAYHVRLLQRASTGAIYIEIGSGFTANGVIWQGV